MSRTGVGARSVSEDVGWESTAVATPAAKMAIELNELHRGFIPINTSTDKNSRFAVVTKPNQSESFIMMREDGADDVAVRSGHFLAGPNQWPNELPGFRETVVAYHDALVGLGHKLCRAVAPGGGKRRSSAAVYLEPWHEVQS